MDFFEEQLTSVTLQLRNKTPKYLVQQYFKNEGNYELKAVNMLKTPCNKF